MIMKEILLHDYMYLYYLFAIMERNNYIDGKQGIGKK
jgi:hypothetical protein